MPPGPVSAPRSLSRLRRWLPAALLVALIAAVYATGFQRYLSLAAIAENREALRVFVADHLFAAILIYMGVYVSAVALSVPGASLLSIVGGFLFGWMVSAPVTVMAATIGATIVFQIVKTSLGAALAECAGPFVRKLSGGFAADAFNYLLFLRLTPVFPFFIVNAVAGLCNVRLKTFVTATFLGIIPGAIAFAYLGTGLDSIIDAQLASYQACAAAKGQANCTLSFDTGALVTRELLIAFAVLGLVSLIPVFIKRWKKA